MRTTITNVRVSTKDKYRRVRMDGAYGIENNRPYPMLSINAAHYASFQPRRMLHIHLSLDTGMWLEMTYRHLTYG